jgi:ATP-dependent DNA helicase RecQ
LLAAKVEAIAEVLQVNGISAVPSCGLDAKTRAKHQDMFLMEDVDVVVAIAFGMGIDKPDARFDTP